MQTTQMQTLIMQMSEKSTFKNNKTWNKVHAERPLWRESERITESFAVTVTVRFSF